MTSDADTARGTLGRVLPGVSVLRRYRRSWLRADVLAGVTVAAYLIPQVMAYAEVAGLAPVAGLWAIIGSLLVYAVFGSSRQLSVGPESTTALMTAVAIAPLAGRDPGRYAALAGALALVVGVICVLGWAARLGVLADLLSRTVLVGYLAGIAMIMIVSQLGKIGRVRVDSDSVLTDLGSSSPRWARCTFRHCCWRPESSRSCCSPPACSRGCRYRWSACCSPPPPSPCSPCGTTGSR